MKNRWYLGRTLVRRSIPFHRKTWKVGDSLQFSRHETTRLFFVLISYLNRLLIQYLVVIHCHLHIGRKEIKISLGWEDRSDDYLTINRCCPNLIEGGGRKKFGFNAIFASMRCDRKRVSIISLLGIYIHSRNGMNNKKKGGKGGTQRSMTRRTWKQTEHD